MADIFELRRSVKNLLKNNPDSAESYAQAVPICREICSKFSETKEFWDIYTYARCLNKAGRTDEAEQVCNKIYLGYRNKPLANSDEKAFSYIANMYAWLIYAKYIKPIAEPGYKHYDTVADKTLLLYELASVKAGESKSPDYPFCVLKVLKQLKKTNGMYGSKVMRLTYLVNIESYSDQPRSFTDKHGVKREVASDREMFYQLKSEILFNNKKYYDCIVCCKEALLYMPRLHYNNNVWFERRIALALGAIGDINGAVQSLEKLAALSGKWFILFEIAKLYVKKGDNASALKYMLRAVCTKEPEKMKVSLIEAIGDILAVEGDKNFAQENYLLAQKIRRESGWQSKERLNKKITAQRQVSLYDIRKKWIAKLYAAEDSKQGKITKIYPEKGGAIAADKQYYFQFKNFFGKREYLKQGDAVNFIIAKTYSKKLQSYIEEACVVTVYN